MRPRLTIWIAAALVAVTGCGSDAPVDTSAAVPTDGSPLTITFTDDATCERLAGAGGCDVVMCDLIPAGSTFEETCGRWFQDGITIRDAASPAGQERIVEIGTGVLTRCEVADVIRDGTGLLVLTLVDGAGVRLGGPPDLLRDALVEAGGRCVPAQPGS